MTLHRSRKMRELEIAYSQAETRCPGGAGNMREIDHPQRGRLLRWFPDPKRCPPTVMRQFLDLRAEVDRLSADPKHYRRA